MGEDLLDDLLVLYEAYNPHLPRALRADKRIYRINFPNKSGPILPRPFRRFVWLQDAGYPFILVFLSAFTTTNVTVIAIIPHHLFTLARDMRTHDRQPFQGVKDLLFYHMVRPTKEDETRGSITSQ